MQGAEKKRSYKLAENKFSYGKDYIKSHYQDSELPAIYLQVQEAWKNIRNRSWTSNESSNELMRKSIFDEFVQRVIDLTGFGVSENVSEKESFINAEIVKSIRSYHSYATTNERGERIKNLSYTAQYGSNIIIRAASHETMLNKSELSTALDIHPQSAFLIKLFPFKKRKYEQVGPDEQVVLMSDDLDLQPEPEPESGIEPADPEMQGTFEDDSVQDSLSIASEEVEHDGYESDNNFAGGRSGFADCLPGRCQYKNARDLKPAIEFWHHMCVVNTNTFQTYCVLDSSNPIDYISS